MEVTELKTFVEEHHRASFCWALSCCGRDPVEAEEVLQTVYLKILEGKACYRGESSIKTWLFAVIRMTAADRRRRSFLGRLRILRSAERLAPPPRVEHPDDAVLRQETEGAFRKALAALPGRQRDALQLVFYHDLSVEEAAAVMGVSLGSARTHYERGKKRLRQELEGSEVLYGSDWRRRENPGEV